jgi:hypothetical protein
MTDHRPSPPEPEECLICSRVSRYKGGTLIAEDVHDDASHQERLASGGYVPGWCPRCEFAVLHVHDYVERRPLGESDLPRVIRVVRYICASPACKATWRILPAFLPRHLWHRWRSVERTLLAPTPPPRPSEKVIPKRTVARWHERLASAARQLVLLLAACCGSLLETIAKRTGLDATRYELVDAHTRQAGTPPGRRLGDLGALVHRLERGIRLM